MTNEQSSPAVAGPVKRRVMRPGKGWRHIGGPVYEHSNGTRVHVIGVVKLPDGRYLHANKWPECIDAARMISINGGNRRRGLMAWAMTYNVCFEPRASSHVGSKALLGCIVPIMASRT